ncbi:MAG: coenzyme F420-0:L-glutamate ligase [Verrucomicrobiaceae bacterium]|nr:coenzyme F420-0:L-glutamate ligase [Verrucomicrobiaceae bacterium]
MRQGDNVVRQRVQMTALPDFPMVEPGDDIAAFILAALDRAQESLNDGDVLVLAQKIVSKSENRYAYLNDVTPSTDAKELADYVDKDPRLVELILRESVEVLRMRKGAIIVEHRNGYVHANAGIDQSNIQSQAENPRVLLLPENPDASAAQLRARLRELTGVNVAVIINDSAGRAWRNGVIGFALGTAGLVPLENRIGTRDLFGRALEITEVAVADEIAAAASLMMGQAAEGAPVVLIRGADISVSDVGSSALIRAREQDLFR